LLKASCQDDGVDICEIFSDPVDRYGDGREIIRFGSPEERHSFLESCSIFLSLGTTFTLEALVHGLDVLHLYIPPQSRSTSEEFSIFQRVEITCDHFFDYFTSKIEFIPTKEIFYKRVAELNNFICNQSQGLDRVGLDHLYDEITLPFTIMKS
jgi:hypothetical protein